MLSNSGLLKRTIGRWYDEKNNKERSGRSNEEVTPENGKQILKIVIESS